MTDESNWRAARTNWVESTTAGEDDFGSESPFSWCGSTNMELCRLAIEEPSKSANCWKMGKLGMIAQFKKYNVEKSGWKIRQFYILIQQRTGNSGLVTGIVQFRLNVRVLVCDCLPNRYESFHCRFNGCPNLITDQCHLSSIPQQTFSAALIALSDFGRAPVMMLSFWKVTRVEICITFGQ